MRYFKRRWVIPSLMALSFILSFTSVTAHLSKSRAIAEPTSVVNLQPGVPILLDSSEPPPIKRAVEDLRRDLKKVLGQDSPVIASTESAGKTPLIVVSYKGKKTKGFQDASTQAKESHAIRLIQANGASHVVLQGADIRGTLYAIYTFSDRFLGVPPLWFWSSWKPRAKKTISVPQRTNLHFDSPHVAWRAWFPNDKDLLDPWVRLSPKNYDAVAETMLRLKLNTLHVGGSIADYGQQNQITPWAQVARDRGLAIITPYFASFENWQPYWQKIRKQAVPELTLKDVQKLENYWTYHIQLAQQQKLEMIWGIGFRGAGDRGFFVDFTDAPESDTARANVIRDMLLRQIKLLRSVSGQSRPLMFALLYRENSDYLASGLLQLFQEPSLIWTFSSEQRDHFPQQDLLKSYVPRKDNLVGYYMNLNYYTTGSHLAEGEGPWKMEDNFRLVEKAAKVPLQLSIVNAGNIREFVMNLSANAEMMWHGEKYDTNTFLEKFTLRYFGSKSSKQIVQLYRDFYNSYWQQKHPNLPAIERQYIFHDLRLAQGSRFMLSSITRRLKKPDASEPVFMPKFVDPNGKRETRAEEAFFRIVPEDSGANNKIEAVLAGTEGSINKLEQLVRRLDTVMKQLPPEYQLFFNDNLRVQAYFMLRANQMLNSIVHSYQALPNRKEAKEHLNAAERATQTMAQILDEANHTSFKAWYNNDKYFGVKAIQKRIVDIKSLL
jgi:hypothetical protein